PPNKNDKILPKPCGLVNNDIIMAVIDPAVNAKKAGTFLIDKNNKTAIGISAAYQLISPVSNKLFWNSFIFVKSVFDIFGDNKANKINDIKKAGNVVQAIFVVSDKGDILSPKNAPETIAPAVIGKETPKAVDIPIKASPTVPTVVSELPTLIPIMAVTTNIIAKKYFGVTSSNPPYISVG